MRLRLWVFGVLAGLAAVPLAARADITVNGGGSAGFQPVGALDQSGPEYWDNKSFDGAKANVGYFLNKSGLFATKFGGTSPAIGVSDLQYWGQASGASDANITFTATGPVVVELLLTLAGDFAVNEFGWYKAGDPNSKVTLFQNGYDAGSGTQKLVKGNNAKYGVSPLAASFKPGGDFGFYLTNALGETFFTESALNTAGKKQGFAVFRSLTDPKDHAYYLGSEDRMHGDFDYNDVVIRMHSPVPEPSSIALVAAGGAMLGLIRLRRRRPAR
jgi:hypothetical protein